MSSEKVPKIRVIAASKFVQARMARNAVAGPFTVG